MIRFSSDEVGCELVSETHTSAWPANWSNRREELAMKEISKANMPVEKRAFNGDVSLLVDLEMLRPLAAFPFTTRPVVDCLHSLGHGWYLLVGSRDTVDDGLPETTVRACMLVWACDVGGALLATGCDNRASQLAPESHNPLPPVKVLVPAKGWSYEELVKAGRGKVMETGSYGSDGVFQYKALRFPKASIFFRSRCRKHAELPFAVRMVGRNRRLPKPCPSESR